MGWLKTPVVLMVSGMGNRDRIFDFVERFPGRDDDEVAALLDIKPRQTVNQICRELVKAGSIERRPGPSGKLANYPTHKPRPPAAKRSTTDRPNSSAIEADATAEWFWEGNVADTIATYLERSGWSILSKANTKTRERGIDLHAERGSREILVEVKGYPSIMYRDPRRSSERKPTNPTLQAQHWYSHALLKAVRLRSAHPERIVAVGLPDFSKYRSLFQETKIAFEQLDIAILFVTEPGEVDAFGL